MGIATFAPATALEGGMLKHTAKVFFPGYPGSPSKWISQLLSCYNFIDMNYCSCSSESKPCSWSSWYVYGLV